MIAPFVPQVAVVDFHHARGPEVEFWVQSAGVELFDANDWSLLPFLALADGAHAVEEEFSYFTLLAKDTPQADSSNDHTSPDAGETPSSASNRSLFGIACMRQIKSDKLKVRSPDVTRSTVQKAVVVVLEKPGKLGEVRERLSAVTSAWFGQADFTDTEILQDFQDSLIRDTSSKTNDDNEHYIGLSLREMVYEFRHQTLVLFKALLLQKKMLFFGSRCERLCLLQFALISLIPNLMHSLQDCAEPNLDSYAKTVTRAVSLRTSERSSLLSYMGLPLQIFGSSSFFSPYTPLQLLDLLMSNSTHSFVVGSTNNLLLSQKDQYTDVLVNLDEEYLSTKIQICNPSLRGALSLSAADRRWIDNITHTVLETWDPDHPSRPTTYGYSGSEEAIRLQFEEYILSLCSSAAYKTYLDSQPSDPNSSGATGHEHHDYADPLETGNDFNNEFLAVWRTTPNYVLFDKLTQDAAIFDVIPPKHPTAGGLNIDDVQRRLAQGVAELHLDERVRGGRETVGRVLGEGRERVGAGVARLWKEVEGFRERREASRTRESTRSSNTDPSQLKDNITGIDTTATSTANTSVSTSESTSTQPSAANATTSSSTPTAAAAAASTWLSHVRDRASRVQIQRPDTAQIGNAARDNAAKAGAYLSSWGSWARDRGKEWSEKRSGSADRGGRSGSASRESDAVVHHPDVHPDAEPDGKAGAGIK